MGRVDVSLPHHDLLTAPGATPDGWLLFLHGILGRGANWRGFARRILSEVPEYGAILVDLRAHAGSRTIEPPDSIESAAEDLLPLIDAHGVKAVLGHSFGGKVALEVSRHRALEQLVLVDSLPAARPERDGSDETLRVVKMLRTLPAHFLDRAAFHRYVEELGFSRELALWLSQNLDSIDDGYELGLDVDRIETLLEDYFAQEFWPVLDPPRAGMDTHLVIAAQSPVFGDDDRARALELAARHSNLTAHVLQHSAHWVHIDDPRGLGRIVVEALT